MSEITVVSSVDRTGWASLTDPPGRLPSPGREVDVFTSGDDAFTCGLWEREPDTWSFERPYDEVAYILEGSADVETENGQVLHLSAGDIFVTPKGSKGTWRIHETVAKFFTIYAGGSIGDTTMRVIGANDPVDWITLDNPPGDENAPGQEWYAWREPRREVLDRGVASRPGDGDVRSRVPRGRVPDRRRRRDRDRGRPRAPGRSRRRHRDPGGLVGRLARVEPRQEVLGGPPRVTRTARWIPRSGRDAQPLLVEAGVATVLLRGLRKRCPRCGERRIFRSWLHLIERCPYCRLTFEREQGGFLGAMTINFLVAVLVWVVVLVVVLVLTVPDVPVAPLLLVSTGRARRGAALVLSAVQDAVGGDRVPGGQERPGLPNAGQA